MSGFKVETELFFNSEVPTGHLLESLRTHVEDSPVQDIASLTFAMNSPDVLHVSFVVPGASTYAETMEVSKRFLDQLTEKVSEFLAHLDAETSIEDDSLLLMPA